MIPLRLVPYAAGAVGVATLVFTSYQLGRVSAERDDRERTIAAIRSTWTAQVDALDDRLAYDTARAVIIDRRLAEIERVASRSPEAIYVTPPSPDCPIPAVNVGRLRDLAQAGNAALAGDPVPAAATSSGPAATDPRTGE